MDAILIVKTAALGDVLRTTSILPGLRERFPAARIAWLTAPGAVDLVRTHPLVARVETVDANSAHDVERALSALSSTRWDWVISLDDEEPLCALASRLARAKLSGAHIDGRGARAYTPDVAPWFDMGLLSVHGKARADQLKIENQKSHPAIHAEMLGVPIGKPALHLPAEARSFARAFKERERLVARAPLIGLNTGAGGRWTSKQLSPERTVALAIALRERFQGAAFLVFGGAAEAARNRAILDGLARAGLADAAVDAGSENTVLDFAALVRLCDVLVTSDSLALHLAIAIDVRVVAFFAPTSAAEIELYGLGEKVASTAADACSYRADADNSTITTERLTSAVGRVLRG